MTGAPFDFDVIEAADIGTVALFNGGTVYAKGDPADFAYIVRRGQIDIRNGDHLIETVKPGEIFGVTALFEDEAQANWAHAVGDTEIIPISRSLFEALIRDDPEFALTIVELVARRLHDAHSRLDSIAPSAMASSANADFIDRASA